MLRNGVASELTGPNPRNFDLVYSSDAYIHVEMRCESSPTRRPSAGYQHSAVRCNSVR